MKKGSSKVGNAWQWGLPIQKRSTLIRMQKCCASLIIRRIILDKAGLREATAGPSSLSSSFSHDICVVLVFGNVGKDCKYRAVLNEWIHLESSMGNVTQAFGLNVGLNSSSFKLSNIQVFACCIDPSLGNGERFVSLWHIYPNPSQRWRVFQVGNAFFSSLTEGSRQLLDLGS